MRKFIPILAALGLLLCGPFGEALAGNVTVTAATGGSAISANTAVSGSWTGLSGPVVTEAGPGGISTGTIILNAPSGFQFNTAAAVTVSVSTVAGGGQPLVLAGTTAGVTSSAITITVTTNSRGTTVNALTWSGIQVRPTACSPLANGNISRSGSAGFSETGGSGSNYGTLTEVAGAAAKLILVQQPSDTLVNAVISPSVTAQAQDLCGNNVSGSRSITISLSSGTGVMSGTTTLTSNASGLATFSDLAIDQTGTKTLSVAATGLSSAVSSAFTVSPVGGGGGGGAVPGSFNAFETSTAAGSVAGVVKTKIAASAFNLDIVALKTGGTALETAFTGGVKLELVDASGGGSCSAYPLIQSLGTLTFAAADSGRKTQAGIAEANAWKNAAIRMVYPASGAATVTACSGDNFAIRPDSLAVAASDGDWQSAGTARALSNTSASGGTLHKAGRPFTLTATAYNSAGAIASNYAGSPAASIAAYVLPATCAVCVLSSGAFSGSGGTVVSNTASYNEAGAFSLQVTDTDFAAVDAADSSTVERYVTSAAINAGRFVPDHFDLSLNTPQFMAGCSAGGFTYSGQPFVYSTAPVISATARNASGGTTQNYTGSLWKITAASLTGKSYTAAAGTLDTSGVPATDPAIADTGSGTGTLTFGSGTGLRFTRPASPTAPFNAEIALAINVIDSDGVAYASNPAGFGAASAGNGIAFSGGKDMRYGRLALGNAYGSELLDLPVPFDAQYWNGSAWALNSSDTCTTGVSLSLTDMSATDGLVPAEVCAWDTGSPGSSGLGCTAAGTVANRFSEPPTVGSFKLNFRGPGAGNSGSVKVTATVPVWLQFDWSGAGITNPSALATFGVYGGNRSPVIYWREQY